MGSKFDDLARGLDREYQRALYRSKLDSWFITQLCNEYSETDCGKKLRDHLDRLIHNVEISEEKADLVYRISAREYDRYVNDPNNAWTNIKLYLKKYPIVFSILDLVYFEEPVRKNIYVLPCHEAEKVKNIFKNYNQKFNDYGIEINNESLIVITSIAEEDHSIEENCEKIKKSNEPWGGNIFHDIEVKNKIHVGYHYYSSSDYHLHNIRHLGISKNIVKYSTGYREDIECGFRSAWEANVARILNYFDYSWEYEVESFLIPGNNYHGYYFPDFIINNEIVLEIKGVWDNDSRWKARLFGLYHPQFNFLFIDREIFFDLQKEFKKIIRNWEICHISKGYEIIDIIKNEDKEVQKYINSLTEGEELRLNNSENNNVDPLTITTKDNIIIGTLSDDWTYIYSEKIKLGMLYMGKFLKDNQHNITIGIKRSNYSQVIIHPLFRIQPLLFE